jgi:hypothetical protein
VVVVEAVVITLLRIIMDDPVVLVAEVEQIAELLA